MGARRVGSVRDQYPSSRLDVHVEGRNSVVTTTTEVKRGKTPHQKSTRNNTVGKRPSGDMFAFIGLLERYLLGFQCTQYVSIGVTPEVDSRLGSRDDYHNRSKERISLPSRMVYGPYKITIDYSRIH